MPRVVARATRATLALAGLLLLPPAPAAQTTPELAQQVEVRRTAYGVPHIRADNLRAAGYALGWVQMEDYGPRVARGLLRARGELALHFGPDSLRADFRARPRFHRALETYHLLDADTRAVYEGFATGVNRYVELHGGELPAWARARFTGHDVHALGIDWADPSDFRRLVARLDSTAVRERAAADPSVPLRFARTPDEGSNAWALAPGRTESGNAILLRNPHLSWDAGYYEAHVTVPGKLNFYGDFRIGGPLGIIGGFNERLGWSTTNNDADTDEVYALDADPARPDHYLFDGGSVPLQRHEVAIQFRNGEGTGRATREHWTTPLGPVIHRANGKIYVHRSAAQGEWRAGMQFLRMMQARSLEQWKDAMRLRGRAVSSFTYADADGNIFYVWNATLPLLPHPSGGDTAAIPARRTEEVWTRVLPWDSLPQLLNPRGGYLHNENDSPFYSNLRQPLYPARYPANVEAPSLRLRSQLALELIGGTDKLSLEEVVRLKHSPRMLLADRVKPDLLAAARAAGAAGDTAAALEVLARWDNTASAASRGSVLFERWWERYLQLTGNRGRAPEKDARVFREPWTTERPAATPRGLADPVRAVAALGQAMEELRREAGGWDIARGDLFRVRHGGVDAPVSGCHGGLGCFRVLWFDKEADGKYAVRGGDGWVLAVEFGKVPRAYSVLAYGQTDRPGAPHHDDQAALFAEDRMKPVPFTEADIRRQTVRSYRPGVGTRE